MKPSTNIRNCRAKDPTTCPYHSILLEMETAKKNFEFDAYADLREKLHRKLATSEFARQEQALDNGQSLTPELDFDSIVRAGEQAAAAAAVAANNDNTLYVPETHTYDAGGRVPVDGDPYGSWNGSRYNPTAEISAIATQIKRDFQAAQAAGFLPQGLTISAKKDVYSGGRAIRVQVSGVADKDRYETAPDGRIRNNAQARLVTRRVEQLVDAYNFMHRTDPYGLSSADSYFATDVKILDDRQQDAEQAEKDAAARVRQAKRTAADLAAQYDMQGFSILRERGLQQVSQTRDGRPIMRIPGTNFLGVGTPNPVASGGHTYKLYNLTAISEGTPGALEQDLSSMTSMRIDAKFRKNRFIS